MIRFYYQVCGTQPYLVQLIASPEEMKRYESVFERVAEGFRVMLPGEALIRRDYVAVVTLTAFVAGLLGFARIRRGRCRKGLR